MEIRNEEMKAIDEVVATATDSQLSELNELQAAFVGGGAGDVIFG
jgi:hypothetical protein